MFLFPEVQKQRCGLTAAAFGTCVVNEADILNHAVTEVLSEEMFFSPVVQNAFELSLKLNRKLRAEDALFIVSATWVHDCNQAV